MLQSTFLTTDRITAIFFCRSNEAQKLNFCDILSNGFITIMCDHAGKSLMRNRKQNNMLSFCIKKWSWSFLKFN